MGKNKSKANVVFGGYIGNSMSVRAKEAYKNGEMPYSKWTKTKILKYLEKNNVEVEKIAKFSKETLETYFLGRSSWHHTGKYYNSTTFYSVLEEELEMAQTDLNAVIEELTKIESSVRKNKALSKNAKIEDKLVIVEVKYGEWEGSRRHPKLKEYTSLGVTKGNWVWITPDKKKSLCGKHVEILKCYNRAPNGSAQQINDIKKAINSSKNKK